jgi:hypothetical protein
MKLLGMAHSEIALPLIFPTLQLIAVLRVMDKKLRLYLAL